MTKIKCKMNTSFQNTVTAVTVNTTAPVAVGAPSVRLALIRQLATKRGRWQAARAAFLLGIPMPVILMALAGRNTTNARHKAG